MSEGSGSVRVTRRRLLGGLITVGGASAAAGAGTVAYFTDSEESTSNSITAGTLNIDFADPGTFQFSTSLAPTQSTQDSVTLVSDGTLDGSLDIDVALENHDSRNADGSKDPQQVAANLEILTLTYGGNPIIDQIDTSNSPPTLADLANNAHGDSQGMPNDLINLGDPGTGTDFLIELRLKDIGDDFQGEGIDVSFTFHLNQNAAQ